jgi:flagellar hook-length control protein FliK
LNSANIAQLESSATKIQLQQAALNSVDGSLQNTAQNTTAPIIASQTGAIQSTQTVINAPVTDKAWGNEFNQKITWMATQSQQTAELHLNPPNLGPLNVVLKVSGDQATALFNSPHAAVRDVVQQALPQLREMLAGNGITLGNAMVSDQSPKEQQAWQASQQQKGNRGAGISDVAAAAGSIASVAAVSSASRHQGMVDTFA